MGVFSRFRRRKQPYAALTDEERISRYVYLLNTLPASVIESAHAKAFADLPVRTRREMFAQLTPFMSESEQRAASDDPSVLARVMRRAQERSRARAEEQGEDAAARTPSTSTALADRPDAIDPSDRFDAYDMVSRAGVASLVANQFLLSAAVAVYFTHGAGSLALGGEPAWVSQTFDPNANSYDGGGFDGGGAGAGGGGYDGGGFSGFDGGGGFGGGFDGGGFG